MEHIRDGLYHEKEGTREYPIGFYWADETEDLNGPYLSLELAKIQMKAYLEWLTDDSDK